MMKSKMEMLMKNIGETDSKVMIMMIALFFKAKDIKIILLIIRFYSIILLFYLLNNNLLIY